MALSVCGAVFTDQQGRELVEHGTPLFPVACYHDNISESGVPWHWHDELEVLVVESGSARVSVNGTDHTAKQGDGFFINAGALHGIWPEGEETCLLRSVVFHPRLVGGSVDSIIWQKYLEPLLCDPCRPCVHFDNAREWEKAAGKKLSCNGEKALRESSAEWGAHQKYAPIYPETLWRGVDPCQNCGECQSQ